MDADGERLGLDAVVSLLGDLEGTAEVARTPGGVPLSTCAFRSRKSNDSRTLASGRVRGRLTTTGGVALAAVNSEPSNIVLSDIRLPDMDGEAIWRRIVEAIGPVPTWFMSAQGDIGQAVRLVKSGACDYLTNPVDIDALMNAVPPLRERSENIVDLARGFAGAAGTAAFEFQTEALEALRAHDWPGNVRELRNRIERAIAMGDWPVLGLEDLFPESRLDFPVRRLESAGLPNESGATGALDAAAQTVIRERVRVALAETGGNWTEAAERLGVSRTTIWKYSKS